MALSRLYQYLANTTALGSQIRDEFDNIYNNALSLLSPLTGNLNFNNNQATNFRFEVQSATQSAAQQGRAYFQSSENLVHVDNGSAIYRVAMLTGIQQGELVGITNPSGVSGSTVYSRIQLGSGLSLSGTSLSVTSTAGGNPIQASIFN